MDKESAILQGAFLLVNKLCHPSSLCSLEKADWNRVGYPVLAALKEISGEEDLNNSKTACWKKKLVCVVWLKLLCREAGEDIETAWRENPLFALQNALPEVNHVVLLELLKSISAADIFANFLLCLPQSQICSELERLVQHVMISPTREDDVRFLLELWWELWKGRDKERVGGGDSIEMLFANQFAHLESAIGTPQAKRMKLDTSASLPHTDVLYILLHALKDMKDHICMTELCLLALSIALDVLYTSYLIEQGAILSTEEKMHFLFKCVSIREKNNEKLSPELILEAQQDLSASHKPSPFRHSKMNVTEALRIVTELAQFWQNGGLLKLSNDSIPTYTTFKLQQSVHRVLTALKEPSKGMTETDTEEKDALRVLLESLSFPTLESTPEVNMRITVTIISHRLEDYQNLASLFAGEQSWAGCGEQWMDCLEKNQAAFQHLDTLIKLTSTLTSKLDSQDLSVIQCRKLMKVVTDVFSALSLEDKNKALAAILRFSSRGFFGCSVPSAVTDGFEQELNMAFNCIIQGGGGALQGNLSTAVALVARVAFQDPEATLRACCHSAIFNKGAFALMAQILQQLPGLGGQGERKVASENKDGERHPASGHSLICRCLQEMIGARSLSGSEKEQLLKFLGLLMTPVLADEAEERKFLSPQEVVSSFVLPHLSFTSQSSVDLELSLKLLHTALCVDVQEPGSAPHWVLGCSPIPLLYVLAQLHNQTLRCWDQPLEGVVHPVSMDMKELLVTVLTKLADVVAAEVNADPSRWSRALFWLYNKMEGLDWTVYFHLKPVWGEHFKNEVPSSLLMVCDLPEQDWSSLDLPQYGQGTGLLAWMECSSLSDSLQSFMLSCLSLDQRQADHVSMFSKGLLVALTQILPWCSVSQWSRLLRTLKELIASGRLHVPFSLEYVDFLPLLDLRSFASELCLSVLLLRVLQLLCGSSCSHWMLGNSWAHVGRLYAHAVREMMNSLRAKLPLPSSGAQTKMSRDSGLSCTSVKVCETPEDSSKDVQLEEGPRLKCKEPQMEEKAERVLSQEVLFVLSQLFCHIQHIQVMMPEGQCEPLFLSSLEVLSHYEAIMAAFPDSSSPLESDNTRHFFSTITDNLENQEMKRVLKQKIAQLVSSAA
ncbi:gem-associated protein 4 [Aulostomus maculatus]